MFIWTRYIGLKKICNDADKSGYQKYTVRSCKYCIFLVKDLTTYYKIFPSKHFFSVDEKCKIYAKTAFKKLYHVYKIFKIMS